MSLSNTVVLEEGHQLICIIAHPYFFATPFYDKIFENYCCLLLIFRVSSVFVFIYHKSKDFIISAATKTFVIHYDQYRALQA